MIRRYLELMRGERLRQLEERYLTDKSLRDEVNEERWARIKASLGTIALLTFGIVTVDIIFPEKRK